jgi:hypothetical protein
MARSTEAMADPPVVSFVVDVLNRLEIFQKTLSELPAGADFERSAVISSIEEIRTLVKGLVA